ncbi:Response regulator/GGDEF domain protein [Sulfitobacter noctilucicola]|uniref:CheY-like chemotaxis protein n=1 Tax=Sulfitobacter noctilucicola TaxID=1342301 RepID=A0A7W6M6R5_9RHOB|nr:response regulator [Sulfitobacter noctilucicola]KIN62033.1 Response regulator/GGDEF domain protein [Sulfitobacter noctilucicola]MBB4173449.1 CheY-like chemotaxis protein [Sulfitobacter noctilucicola]
MLHVNSAASSFPPGAPMPRDIKALLLDDSNFDRARIRRLSEKTNLCVHMDEVDSIEAMDRAVNEESYDLVLIDYRLPIGDGMVALDHLLRNDSHRQAAKIMITGDNGKRTAIEAMRNGCHDFLTKEELDVEALREAMLNALATAQHRHELDIAAQMQRTQIREGLVEALQDKDVQSNVIALVRENLSKENTAADILRSRFGEQDIDDLLVGLDKDDTFVFH